MSRAGLARRGLLAGTLGAGLLAGNRAAGQARPWRIMMITWRGWEEMFEFATFVGVSRPGFELSDTHLAEIRDGRVYLLEIPALAISSTECRRRAAEDAPVWYLVPDGVVQYIAKRNLYRPEGSTRLDGTPAATAPVHRVPVPTDPHPEEKSQ